MQHIHHIQLDCQMFVDFMREQVKVVELADISNDVPTVGFGGAVKSFYKSPKSGRDIYILERTGMYDCDAFVNDVWQFYDDFTPKQANVFLTQIDAQKER